MRLMRNLAAAAALVSFAGVAPMPERHILPRAPSTGVVRPPSKRRKDKNDPKRRKPIAAETRARRFAEALGLAPHRYHVGREGRRAQVANIRQAMKIGGAKIEIKNPSKYLHSHARCRGAASAA